MVAAAAPSPRRSRAISCSAVGSRLMMTSSQKSGPVGLRDQAGPEASFRAGRLLGNKLLQSVAIGVVDRAGKADDQQAFQVRIPFQEGLHLGQGDAGGLVQRVAEDPAADRRKGQRLQ